MTLNLSWKVFSSKCLHRLFFDAVNWLSPNSVCVFVSCSFKVKSPDVFDIWVCKLRNHRLFRQNEIVRSPRDATLRTFPPSAAAESPQNTPSSTHQNKVTAAHSCPLFVWFFIFEGLSVVISLKVSMKINLYFLFLIVHNLFAFRFSSILACNSHFSLSSPSGRIMGRKCGVMLTLKATEIKVKLHSDVSNRVCMYVPLQQGKPSSLPWHLPPSCSNGQSKVAAWLKESEEMDKCAEGNT